MLTDAVSEYEAHLTTITVESADQMIQLRQMLALESIAKSLKIISNEV